MNKKLFWILALLLAWFGRDGARGQTTVIQRPDCFLPLSPLTAAVGAAGTSAGPFDNRTLGCNFWILDYNSRGFTVLSLLVQVAPNAAGDVPGTWATYAANAPGINPNTAITQATTTFGGLSSGSTVSYFPWLRVQLTSVTGTGSIQGVLYGWKIPAEAAAAGCPGTVATPCVVVGPTAAGSPPTTSPVLVAGQDGSPGNIQVVKVDTSGRPIVVGAAATGAAIAGNPVNIGTSDGVNIVQPFVCTNQALFNLSGSGNTQIIAASGSTTIRICHISMATVLAEDIKITRGTGANCGTGTADVTGLYKSVQGLAFDFSPSAALLGAASGAICINQSVAQALGGVVIYAQF